jgi:hypothetical protein
LGHRNVERLGNAGPWPSVAELISKQPNSSMQINSSKYLHHSFLFCSWFFPLFLLIGPSSVIHTSDSLGMWFFTVLQCRMHCPPPPVYPLIVQSPYVEVGFSRQVLKQGRHLVKIEIFKVLKMWIFFWTVLLADPAKRPTVIVDLDGCGRPMYSTLVW